MKEVKDAKTFHCKLYLDGETEYTISFQPKANARTINQNDLEKDSLTKQFIEILIQDILIVEKKVLLISILDILLVLWKQKEEII